MIIQSLRCFRRSDLDKFYFRHLQLLKSYNFILWTMPMLARPASSDGQHSGIILLERCTYFVETRRKASSGDF